MFGVNVVLCLGLVIGEGLGEECGDKNRQFGDNSVVFGENELGEEDSVALERTRRSFYRFVFLLIQCRFLQCHGFASGVEQLLARRHLKLWTISCLSLDTTGGSAQPMMGVRLQ